MRTSSSWISAPASSTSANPPEERTKLRIPRSAHSRSARGVAPAGRMMTATSQSAGRLGNGGQDVDPQDLPPFRIDGVQLSRIPVGEDVPDHFVPGLAGDGGGADDRHAAGFEEGGERCVSSILSQMQYCHATSGRRPDGLPRGRAGTTNREDCVIPRPPMRSGARRGRPPPRASRRAGS